MIRRNRLVGFSVGLVLVAILLAFWIHDRRRRAHPNEWPPSPEDTGEYAGSLIRPSPRYDPSKPPSRPWLDPKQTAPPPASYHTYAASSINGQQTDYLLYLPPGYSDPVNAARRYPVIYWLHGYAAEPQFGLPFVETLDAAIRAGRVPPMIAVLPNGLHDSWYVDSVDASQPIESIIIKDLMPHIDQTYRTIADRRGRAVEGFSMGGWGAGHLAFKYPDHFCAVTMVSALLYRHDHFPQFQRIFSGSAAAYYAEDPITRAHRDADKLKDKVRVRLLAGANDNHFHGLTFANRFDERLTEWNYPHELTIIPGVDHNDGEIYQKLGPAVFDFYKEVFAASQK